MKNRVRTLGILVAAGTNYGQAIIKATAIMMDKSGEAMRLEILDHIVELAGHKRYQGSSDETCVSDIIRAAISACETWEEAMEFFRLVDGLSWKKPPIMTENALNSIKFLTGLYALCGEWDWSEAGIECFEIMGNMLLAGKKLLIGDMIVFCGSGKKPAASVLLSTVVEMCLKAEGGKRFAFRVIKRIHAVICADFSGDSLFEKRGWSLDALVSELMHKCVSDLSPLEQLEYLKGCLAAGVQPPLKG